MLCKYTALLVLRNVFKKRGYEVVCCGETLNHFEEGGWVYFHPLKKYVSDYWLWLTYHDIYILEYDRPTSV